MSNPSVVSVLPRILKFARPYRKSFWGSVILTILIAGISPARPWLVQYTFDNFILKPNPEKLVQAMALLVAMLIVQSLMQYYYSYLTNWLGQMVIRDLRIKLFDKLLHFKLKYFDNTPVGVLITRTISDMESIADIFSEGIIVILGDILQLSAIIGFMFYLDWKLTLISMSTLPFLFIATNFFKNGIKSTFNEVRTQVAHLNTFVQEHLTGMSVVQTFNREQQEFAKFKEVNKKHRDANIRSVWYYSIFFPVVEILSAASIGLLVWWGAGKAVQGSVSIGSIVAFIMYINMLFRPIRELADKINTLQMGVVSSERVFKVIDTEASIPDTGTKTLQSIDNIKFEKVWFAYNDEQWVLKGIDFEVKEGQTIALVGATGAGKSSVVNILNRFYEINKGTIFINGLDIHDYKLQSLRNNVGLVLQDVFLFTGTVLDNITLKDPTISYEQVVEAAKIVGAHDFISKLPGGYSYNVQERGATLSVGQRQLISFIRAYVRNPKILILDEATSSVDTESEQMIQYATERLTENRTSIVIAHRLATIQKANTILVFEHGEIVERGSHQELIRLNGVYHKTVNKMEVLEK